MKLGTLRIGKVSVPLLLALLLKFSTLGTENHILESQFTLIYQIPPQKLVFVFAFVFVLIVVVFHPQVDQRSDPKSVRNQQLERGNFFHSSSPHFTVWFKLVSLIFFV